MAAAGSAGLNIALELIGIGDVVQDIRTTADRFDGLASSARGANDQIAELRARLSSGASAGTFGGIAAGFRAIGIAAESIPDVAGELRERLFHDPLAIGTFGRQVLPSRLGGPQDEGATLREAIKLLRETKNAEERLFKARRLGIEAMLPLADIDERHYRAMVKEGEIRGALVDEELRGLRGIGSSQQQRLDDLSAERDLVRERINSRFNNWFRDHITLPVEEFGARAERALVGRLGLGPRASGRADGGGSLRDELRANTEALRQLKGEYANAGPRAAGAVPRGLRGTALEKALEASGFQYGAFSVSAGSQ